MRARISHHLETGYKFDVTRRAALSHGRNALASLRARNLWPIFLKLLVRLFLAGQATFNSSPLATACNQVDRRATCRAHVMVRNYIGHVGHEAEAYQNRYGRKHE
jgi:hypothetical protein